MSESRRVALVTGANRGIGLEIARGLGRQGWAVIVGSRSKKNGDDAAKMLVGEGAAAVAEPLDVTDARSIERAVGSVLERFGRIDALVNNAAVLLDHGDHASSIDLEIVRTTLETNVLGAWSLCQAIVPSMRKRRYGRIVNLTSAMGSLGDLRASGGGYPAYRLSKAAINALTVLLAAELEKDNILVNAAGPGWVRTRMGGPSAPRSVEQGADTPIWLATLPDGGPSGGLFQDRRPLEW